MTKIKNKTKLLPVCFAAFTVLVNAAAYFFLPPKIKTGLFSGGNTVDTPLYLALAAALTALSAAAGLFLAKKNKKYFLLTGILTVFNLICLAVNL